MKTIEERAKDLASKSEELFQKTAYTYYICGAREQRNIDIEKECAYLARYTDMFILPGGVLDAENFINGFKETMNKE